MTSRTNHDSQRQSHQRNRSEALVTRAAAVLTEALWVYMWPRLLAATRSNAELWSLPLLLIATTLPSFDVWCMNRNARVPRAANRGKRAVSHHNRKAKRPRKGTPTLNKRGR